MEMMIISVLQREAAGVVFSDYFVKFCGIENVFEVLCGEIYGTSNKTGVGVITFLKHPKSIFYNSSVFVL